MNIFVWKWSKVAAQKKVFFFTFFGLLRFLVFFNGLFAPTSQSWMSNIFKDSESLGKSNGKKWSQIWTFLFENCLELPRKKKFFSSLFSVFFGFRSFLTVFLPPLLEVGCPIFCEIRNPWGKVIERSGLTFEHFVWKGSKIAAQKKLSFLLSLPWSTLLWHRCYYPHRSRDALSPVCGIFLPRLLFL